MKDLYARIEKMADDMGNFRRMMEVRKFRHPATGNEVKFRSLPYEEQRKVYESFARQQQAQRPQQPQAQRPAQGPSTEAPPGYGGHNEGAPGRRGVYASPWAQVMAGLLEEWG